jgi:hypothetical protein
MERMRETRGTHVGRGASWRLEEGSENQTRFSHAKTAFFEFDGRVIYMKPRGPCIRFGFGPRDGFDENDGSECALRIHCFGVLVWRRVDEGTIGGKGMAASPHQLGQPRGDSRSYTFIPSPHRSPRTFKLLQAVTRPPATLRSQRKFSRREEIE